jgi:hypothetical protein
MIWYEFFFNLKVLMLICFIHSFIHLYNSLSGVARPEGVYLPPALENLVTAFSGFRRNYLSNFLRSSKIPPSYFLLFAPVLFILFSPFVKHDLKGVLKCIRVESCPPLGYDRHFLLIFNWYLINWGQRLTGTSQ